MLIKILIGGLLIFMIFNLFRAMKIMLSDQKPEQNMSTYIGRRVLASVAIMGRFRFFCLRPCLCHACLLFLDEGVSRRGYLGTYVRSI